MCQPLYMMQSPSNMSSCEFSSLLVPVHWDTCFGCPVLSLLVTVTNFILLSYLWSLALYSPRSEPTVFGYIRRTCTTKTVIIVEMFSSLRCDLMHLWWWLRKALINFLGQSSKCCFHSVFLSGGVKILVSAISFD